MTASIFIDGSAWNVLCDQEVDLYTELPPEEFLIFSTNEVDIEIAAMPDVGKDGSSKAKVKRYIAESLERGEKRSGSPFGFHCNTGPQTYSPFNQGTFQPKEHRDSYARPENKQFGKVKDATGLARHAADASLAVHSSRSIILTNDAKRGPPKIAVFAVIITRCDIIN